MAQQRNKKLTRQDKIKMSKQNICWKCGNHIEYNKEIRSLKCETCGLIIDVKSKQII